MKSKAELLSLLKQASEILGKTPTQGEMLVLVRTHKMPYPTTYAYAFGNWNKAVKKAGLKVNAKGSKSGSVRKQKYIFDDEDKYIRPKACIEAYDPEFYRKYIDKEGRPS